MACDASTFRLYVLLGFCLIFGLSTETVIACNTPKGQVGECIPLIDCKSLFQILKKRPVSPTDIKFLQESTCDVNESQPKVCCPKSSTDINNKPKPTLPETPTTTITKPNPPVSRPAPSTNELLDHDITAHKNFNLLPTVNECGISELTQRITGGEDAGLGSYPWMALLGFSAEENEPVQYACGGSLINSKYVLTAAHCVANLPYGYKLRTVRLGEYDQNNGTDCEVNGAGIRVCAPPVQDMDIDQVIAHENYDKTKSRENDIALIRLKKHVALGPYVMPVCIPHGEKLQKSGKNENKVFVAGWGRLAYDLPENSPVLQVVTLRLVSMDDCNKFYADKEHFGNQLDDGRFCAAGEPGKDSCKGDSGGPLMMPLKPKSTNGAFRVFQLGVVSLGPSRCGTAGQPALYSKISYFLKWILDTIRR